MKRIISWVVLYLITCLVSILTSVVVGIGSYILKLINELSIFLKVLIYLFGGTTFISLLFLPVHYGSLLAISASEAIKNSKKGMRYIIFAIYMLITSIIYIIIGFMEDTFYLNTIIMCVYYVMLIIFGCAVSSENGNNTNSKAAKILKKHKLLRKNTTQNGTVNEQESLLDDAYEFESDELIGEKQLNKEEEKRDTEDVKSTNFITTHIVSPKNGYYKNTIERTEKNASLIDKWLDESTKCLYMAVMYRDGKAESFFVNKEFFETIKNQLDL